MSFLVPSRRYPRLLQHLRYCKNTQIPDAAFWRRLVDAQNHFSAYRKKTFFSYCAAFDTMGASGTTTYARAYVRTGYAVSEIRFDCLVGTDINKVGDAHVHIDVTEVGGATETIEVYYGNADTTNDSPNNMGEMTVGTAVSPDTEYEIAIKGIDGGRPLAVCAYEWSEPVIDSRDYFAQQNPSVWYPIYDSIRQDLLQGASLTWMAGGAPLAYWPGRLTGTARSVTGTTWTNVVDGTSTTISSSTPGFDFSTAGAGDGALESLGALCRLKDAITPSLGPLLPLTMAVYGNASSAGGAVRFHDGTRTLLVNNIGTALQWWTDDSSLPLADTVGKMDLLARHDTAGQTVNVYAVSLFVSNA